jgi:RimJ/RimL family protein N-acetyltransferase
MEHAAKMVSVLADPALYVHIGGEPPTLDELRVRYARQVLGEGWFNWMLRLRDDGRLVGFVQATLRGDEAILAWLVAPEEQGRGLATEAATAVIEWLPTAGASSFTAFIHPDNVASEAVARRLGLAATDVVKDGETQWRSSR